MKDIGVILLAAAVVSANVALAAPAQESRETVFQTEWARMTVDAAGRISRFVDRRTARDHCAAPLKQPIAVVRMAGKTYEPTACRATKEGLALDYGEQGPTVVLRVTPRHGYLVIEIASISDPGVDQVVLHGPRLQAAQVRNDMSGVLVDAGFACALRTIDDSVGFRIDGGATPSLEGVCERPGKLVGARIALAACPVEKLRSTLKGMLRTEGVLRSALGGPYALDAPENRGSYIFAAAPSEKSIADWIALCKRAGIAELHMISWERSSGHYEPNKTLWPNGLAGLAAAVSKVHAAGLKAGMHTLTGFVSPDDPFATPVPDRRLSVDASFDLSAPVGASDAAIPTDQQAHDLDTIWAYGSRGNVLRIDDELIMYSSYSQQAPFGFAGCTRGAFGTKPQAHAKGAKVSHLRVYAGCFLPDETTALIDDIAQNIATVFNACRFDMIYMDGAEGTPGGWQGVYKMRAAIFRRLKGRALVEASEWGYSSWPFHSRIGAWDYPNWGLKPLIDLHCKSNLDYQQGCLLPAQIGWWDLFGPNDDHYAEMPDEIEYLCCKSLAFDMPLSFQGITPGTPENLRQGEYLDIIGRYEKARLARLFPATVLAQLRAPGQDFHLERTKGGTMSISPTDYLAHKVATADASTNRWTVRNRYEAQPAHIRIQALYSSAPYGGAEGIVLTDFQASPRMSFGAATGSLRTMSTVVEGRLASAHFTATGSGPGTSWACASIGFDPHRDLTKYGALGVWVHGDGKGEVLNLQLTNPTQYWPTCDEHYVRIDFTGWRYFELHLRERDAEEYRKYAWPYGDSYSVYRNPLIRAHVSALNLYLGHLPAGQEVACDLSIVRALPVVKSSIANPSITIGSTTVMFPVTLESGQFLEMNGPDDCRAFDANGKLLWRVRPTGVPLQAEQGTDSVRFACGNATSPNARALVTVSVSGPPLASARPAR